MAIDRSKRNTFDSVADLYDEVRPEYPEALIDDVIQLSNIASNGRILEIGCGPGNSTAPYAQRGYQILAIELGERLAKLAARKFEAFPKVTILNETFEHWKLEEGAFDLAIAADAFHWIPPEVGYPRVAKALKSTGSAAFYWTVPVDPQTQLSAAIDSLYTESYNQFPNPNKSVSAEWLEGIILENFKASGCFGTVTVKHYTWNETLTSEKYIKELQTFSSHQGVDEAARNQLYKQIKAVIDHYGGEIIVPYSAALFHAPVA